MDSTPTRFGSDLGALRSEDEPLVTGRGRFTDDLGVAGAAHAVFVRAPVGHATLRAVDTAAASASMPARISPPPGSAPFRRLTARSGVTASR